MNDAIYRQQAIDTIKELREVAWKNWHEPTLSPNVVIDALSDLPSAPSRTGEWIPWIPCSERLPEVDETVLVTTAWGDVTIAERIYQFINDINNICWFIHDNNTNATFDDVAAWMPLPEPYKERREE